MTKDAKGMKGIRARTIKGPLRKKRGDTHISTIEEKYDLDLNVRSDMELDNYLKREGLDELSDLLDRENRK